MNGLKKMAFSMHSSGAEQLLYTGAMEHHPQSKPVLSSTARQEEQSEANSEQSYRITGMKEIIASIVFLACSHCLHEICNGLPSKECTIVIS